MATDWGAVLVSGIDFSGGLQNNTANPNYISAPVKGNGLLNKSNGLHSIQIQTTNFTGNIQIEATLDKNANTAVWIPVNLTDTESGAVSKSLAFSIPQAVPGNYYSGSITTQINKFYSIVGQYAWIRANVSVISGGILQSIKLAF